MLVYYESPHKFVALNYTEISKLVKSVCSKKRQAPYFEEVLGRLVLRTLQGRARFDANRGCKISTWISMKAYWILCEVINEEESKNFPQNRHAEVFYEGVAFQNDALEEMYTDIDEKVFRERVEDISVDYRPKGALPQSFYLRVYDALVEGRSRTEIRDKFKVSLMHLSYICKDFRERFHKMVRIR